MSEALRLAAVLEDEKMHSMAIDTEAAAELRRLHAENEALKVELHEQARVNGMGGEREASLMAELERKSDAIQRLWKERDELRSENRTLVRQNGEWQEFTAELVEALKGVLEVWQEDPAYGNRAVDKAWELLVKVEASK